MQNYVGICSYSTTTTTSVVKLMRKCTICDIIKIIVFIVQNLADNDDGECHHAISLEIHSLERKAGGRLNEVRI